MPRALANHSPLQLPKQVSRWRRFCQCRNEASVRWKTNCRFRCRNKLLAGERSASPVARIRIIALPTLAGIQAGFFRRQAWWVRAGRDCPANIVAPERWLPIYRRTEACQNNVKFSASEWVIPGVATWVKFARAGYPTNVYASGTPVGMRQWPTGACYAKLKWSFQSD